MGKWNPPQIKMPSDMDLTSRHCFGQREKRRAVNVACIWIAQKPKYGEKGQNRLQRSGYVAAKKSAEGTKVTVEKKKFQVMHRGWRGVGWHNLVAREQ